MFTNSSIDFQCYFLSETAITLKFGDSIDDSLFERISQFNQLLSKQPFEGMVTTVQAYATLTVYFNPLLVLKSKQKEETYHDKVVSYLHNIGRKAFLSEELPSRHVEIPVCYEANFGLDLTDIAEHTKFSVEQIIELHSNNTYKVHMIGFVPGFAYMGGMDQRLAMPRKMTPRKEVPMGSVGIAGGQTGIYPLSTPGGWQILGRTPLKLFSLDRAQPSLLEPGDLVSFRRIDQRSYTELFNASHAN